MAPPRTRKPKSPAAGAEFPPECCGVCHYSEPTDDEAFLCWGTLPVLHEGTGYRGLPIDPKWQACAFFKGRQHA